MSTANAASTHSQDFIDRRLDMLDQSLLGLLPRAERLEIVSRVESSIRDGAGDGALDSELESLTPATGTTGERARSPRRRRSQLAVSSGVIGIVAMALLVAMPIVYLCVALVSELLGEFVTVAFLGVYVFIVGLFGSLAVFFGTAALIRLARSQTRLTGRAWAITGLCTGPMPMMAGVLLVLLIGAQVAESDMVSVHISSGAEPADMPVNAPNTACAVYGPPALTAVPPSYGPASVCTGPVAIAPSSLTASTASPANLPGPLEKAPAALPAPEAPSLMPPTFEAPAAVPPTDAAPALRENPADLPPSTQASEPTDVRS